MTHRIIVALDVPEADVAVALATRLQPVVAMCKVGLESFVGHGPALVRRIRHTGVDVFLDLKLHDIPRTAAAAAAQVGNLDVRLLTVHASGGAPMIEAVRRAVPAHTKILAVTVLTSLDDTLLQSVGYKGDVTATVRTLGKLALDAGADGLVCSPHELAALSHLPGLRVVPGVRPAGTHSDDQRRVATPQQAVQAGATYIVMGRPILAAANPVAACRAVNEAVGP